MALTNITFGSYFPAFDKGRPVFSGFVFAGVVDTDPRIVANQVQISVRQQDGSIVEVSQPQRLSPGGVPTFQGSPVELLVDGQYSLMILDSKEDQVYYRANVANPITDVNDRIDDIANNTDPAKGSSLVGHILNAIGAISAFAWNVKDAINHLFDVRVSITDPRFGAVGDGVTDDTAAIQLAIDSAEAIYFPAGQYLTVPTVLSHAANNWFLTLRVPANRRLYGPGEILTAAVFANRTQVFSITGSNVTIEELTITNTVNDATQPWSIGVGFATNRDDSILVADYSTVRVRNCTFNRNFLATSIFFDPADSAATFTDCIVESCTANGHPFVGGSAGTGNFDYHYTTNCSYFNNHAFGATFASSYNMVGVQEGVISGNYAQDNEYAGAQVENGTENITIVGNTFVNCNRGVWIDDSSKITVTGNTITGGDLGRRGVYITHEGFVGELDYITNDIVISGNNLIKCYINSSSFGGGGGGQIDRVNITGNNVDVSGFSQQSAVRLKPCSVITLSSNTLRGGTDETISVDTQAGQVTTIVGNMAVSGGDGGISCNIVSGLGERVILGNQFGSGASLSGSQLMNNVSGIIQSTSLDGFINARGTGTPEGVVAAPKGSTYQRLDGGANTSFYIKETGSGDTGWVGK